MKKHLLSRLIYYFRIGYGQYFMFIFAILNMYTLTYYLAIDNYDALASVFPSFSYYVIVSSIIGMPVLVLLGYIHIVKSHAFKSSTEIHTESNPYMYLLLPGIQTEVMAPLLLDLIRLLKKSDSAELDDEENARLKQLDAKLEFLANGGMLDIPKKFNL